MTQNETVRCGMPQRDQAREVTDAWHLDCTRITGYPEVKRATFQFPDGRVISVGRPPIADKGLSLPVGANGDFTQWEFRASPFYRQRRVKLRVPGLRLC